ncbi:hypothetical protein B0H17DRAFT_1083021 [Mycena rosella]|uniref:Uncharacterized protein n=1 Tax=Mycena rosella TaxID=1033263 RepID=A0AAD7D1A1_MYCRO|nr:hypothetical protein B0H17DRAFT_1083021 [Mycena rosella]
MRRRAMALASSISMANSSRDVSVAGGDGGETGLWRETASSRKTASEKAGKGKTGPLWSDTLGGRVSAWILGA